MFCPIRALNPQITDECVEKHCAFWCKGECVIKGYLRSFIQGPPEDRDEPGGI